MKYGQNSILMCIYWIQNVFANGIYRIFIIWSLKSAQSTVNACMLLADPGGALLAHAPPNRINFFHFRIRFCQKVYASEVGAPPQQVGAPLNGKSWIRHCMQCSKACMHSQLIELSLHMPTGHWCARRSCPNNRNLTQKILLINNF